MCDRFLYTESLRRWHMGSGIFAGYFYPVVGGALLVISPYVIVYEGNTLLGIAFGVLGISLLADEWVGEDEKPDGQGGEDSEG